MEYLREKTTSQVVCGPFLTTGASALASAIVLTTVDEAVIQKHGVTAVVSVTAATWSTITNLTGYFNLEITTGMSDTPGRLDLCIRDDDACLPYTKSFMVVGAQVYDSLWGSSSGAYPTVNVMQINSQASAATALEGHISSIIAGITSIKAETTAMAVVLASVHTETSAIHSETTLIHAETTQIHVETSAIKAETTLIHGETTQIHAETTQIHVETSGLVGPMASISTRIESLQADTTAMKPVLTSIDSKLDSTLSSALATNLATIMNDLTSIKGRIASVVEDVWSRTSLSTDFANTAMAGYKLFEAASGAGLTAGISSIAGETTSILAKLTCVHAETSSLKVSMASVLNQTTALIDELASVHAEVSAIKDIASAIKAETTLIHGETTQIHAETTQIHVETSGLVGPIASISTRVEELQADTTAMGIILSSVHAETTLIHAETTQIHEETTLIHGETSAIKLSLSTIESTALMDSTYEGDYKLRDYLRLSGAVLFGLTSGGNTTTLRFRDIADTKDRIVANVSTKGNRETMTLDAS